MEEVEIKKSVSLKAIDRQSSKLDQQISYSITDKQTRTGAENKQKFMENYGIKFEIPSYYIQDSKFYKKNA